MIKYTHICDNCKDEVVSDEQFKPKNWKDIRLEYSIGRYTAYAKHYTLCPKCQVELGMPTSESEPLQGEERDSLENRLFDIFREITTTVQEGR